MANEVLHRGVQLHGRQARADQLIEKGEDSGQQSSGFTHQRQLIGGLDQALGHARPLSRSGLFNNSLLIRSL